MIGAEFRQEIDAERTENETEGPATEAQQNGFNHDLTQEVAATGSEGLTHGEFLGATVGADEKEVHEVDRTDEEQGEDADLEEKQNGPDFAHVVGVERIDVGVVVRVADELGVGIIFQLFLIEGVHLSLRIGEGDAGGESGDQIHIVAVPVFQGAVVGIGGERDEKLGPAGKKTKVRREHADDGVGE